jgi:ABC-type dipeptide/oligopeptide/nickel transport system ATPase subunit
LEIGRILADEAILIEDGRPIANGDYSTVSIKYLQSFAHHADIKAEVKRTSMPGRELVTYENVNVGYSAKRPVIESARVQLHESSRILITGKSGSGKSTLLRSFFDHEIQISGKTTFHEPFGAKKRAQGKHLGVVFQDSWSSLSPRLSVREILLETSKLAEEKITLPAITDWLARAGLNADVLRKLPH